MERADVKATAGAFRNVNMTELLTRREVVLDNESISRYLTGSVVLVTGGGGSVGSELCRQIMNYRPKRLLILDIYENCAYELQMELSRRWGANAPVEVLIGSIRDERRLEEIFSRYRPEVVFHAAAHKHVPLMEASPAEAVKNNIFGTQNLLATAERYGTERFVQLSTDKAVNPTSVMGCTKRVCEMLNQSTSAESKMKCVSVRFGNVLGSRGSVIPLFEAQIRKGGPVTITHPDIMRYFMTIPEAAGLVLQAGGMAETGSIYVLDMGKQVRIADLAERLIGLYGYRPGSDIKLEYTGLRPGEKLYEELLSRGEMGRMRKTAHDRIFAVPPPETEPEKLRQLLARLERAAERGGDEVIPLLAQLVPGYCPAAKKPGGERIFPEAPA